MTVEQFAERIKNYYKHYNGKVSPGMVVYYIDHLLKEHKNEGKDTQSVARDEREAKEVY